MALKEKSDQSILLFDLFLHITSMVLITGVFVCLQCFDAVGWAAGRASGL